MISEAGKTELINNLYIDMLIKDKLKTIVDRLANKSFNDSDISFLDNQLIFYIDLVLETLNIKLNIREPKNKKPKYMNDYGYDYYSKYFNFILSYFIKNY
jgi:hypothetical protein